ncbi:MAG TPA: restriction endonuclease subunit S [Arsenophonus nasoniae]|uniref:Restriction endonuclease subunit S n=1 Tax=Arsenophonus nasoniae TaxID=638 RepID=A0AA95GEX9_9GAMM|nr:restriction endonuclease subunit S [Arsenophonus nasoniae]WGL95078.1 restriction endonuclease subunit S [Arsenophonus nasoniae]
MSWKEYSFIEVCDIQGGTQPPKEEFIYDKKDGYIRLLQIQDFKREDKAVYIKDRRTLKKCNNDDILIGRYGASIGKIFSGLSGAYNVALVKAVPDLKKINKRFLWHFLNSAIFQEFIKNVSTRAAQAGFNKDDLAKLKIYLPPINEQKRIAAILDKADGIRQKREQAIKLADDFLYTKFLEMFSNEKIKKYSITKIDALLAQKKNSIRTGPFGSQLLHSEFTQSGIAVLGIDNAVKNEFQWGKPRFISQSKYETLKRYTVFPGDVIVTIMGTCGRCAVVPSDIPTAINTKHLCCISLDKSKCIPEFLHSYFHTHPLAKEYLAKHSKGAIMDGLNMGVIKHMPFPEIPLEQQCEFVNIKEKIKKLKNKLDSSKVDCEYIFTTLCNDTFNMQG